MLAKRARVSRGTVANIEAGGTYSEMKLLAVQRALEAGEAERDRVRHTSDGTSPARGAPSHAQSPSSSQATISEAFYDLSVRLAKLAAEVDRLIGSRLEPAPPTKPAAGPRRRGRAEGGPR